MATAYRYGDMIALAVGKGETRYLTPADARKLARHINRVAREIAKAEFVASITGTITVPDHSKDAA